MTRSRAKWKIGARIVLFNGKEKKFFLGLPETAVLIIFAFTRIFLLWKNGDAAFGYDTGIYRRVMLEYFVNRGLERPPFAFSFFSDFLLGLGMNLDWVAYGAYVAAHALIFFLLYFLVREYGGRKSALIAIFLYTFSSVQFEFYGWYYYRQTIACAAILAGWLLMKKNSFFSAPFFAAAALVHPLSMAPICAASVLVLIFKKDKKEVLRSVMVFSGMALALILNWKEFFLYWNIFWDQGGVVSFSDSNQEFGGQFIGFWFFMTFSFFYLPFTAWGFWKNFKKEIWLSFFFLSCAALLFSRILFYRRFYVFLDIAVIIFASLALAEISERFSGRIVKYGFAVWSVLFIAVFSQQVFFHRPLISQAEILEIGEVCDRPRKVLSVSSHYAPWLYGFGKCEVIAPGMFESNLWSFKEWMEFWQTDDFAKRRELMARYGQSDLLVYIGKEDIFFAGNVREDTNFQQISDGFWVYGWQK